MKHIITVSLIIAAFLTFILNHELDFKPVIASASIGLIGGVLGKILKNEKLGLSIYCGSFIGMSSALLVDNYIILLIASLVSSFIFRVGENTFVGIGGKLGSIAFIGVSFAVFISFLVRNLL